MYLHVHRQLSPAQTNLILTPIRLQGQSNGSTAFVTLFCVAVLMLSICSGLPRSAGHLFPAELYDEAAPEAGLTSPGQP